MRFITVLGIFIGIPAAFIFLHVNNRVEKRQQSPSSASIIYYEEQQVDRCFFWTEEDSNIKTSEEPFVGDKEDKIKYI